MKKYIIPVSALIIVVIGASCTIYYNKTFDIEDTTQNKNGVFSYKINEGKQEEIDIQEEKNIDDNIKKIVLSTAGDCTLGSDDNFGYNNSFYQVFKNNNNDYSYFFKNVKDIFDKDDITLVNLEGTFTDSNIKREKAFNFKGPADYVNILKEGSIEVVNIANNHSHDYEEQGYKDTKQTLEDAGVDYCGNSSYYIKDINGIKVGMFGLMDINSERYTDVKKAIKHLKDENCNLIIANMHWGIEKDYNQNSAQIKLGHYMIDNGVDLVVGTHPHVIQGIEKYNNKYIIYSLANFAFGGNKNPSDKDTFIYQQTFTFKDNELQNDDNIKIIPALITSDKKINNYQPTIAEGSDAIRVMDKIKTKSSGFEYNW